MLLSSVILVLQETLEAALLISVLMAVSHLVRQRISWLAWGLCTGAILSSVYSINMQTVSEWFDYVGQEVVNALLQTMISVTIILLFWAVFETRTAAGSAHQPTKRRYVSLFQICAALAVTLTITREGSEILLYLGGFFQQSEEFQAILTGSAIGFSIGVSVGFLLFYGLMSLPGHWGFTSCVLLMSLFAGNMFSQATLLLTQADWLPSASALWDTSAWLPENSISGQLLYASIGYEATPSWIQFVSYLAGTAMVLAVAFKANYWANRGLFLK
jgi:high-affinity iron transporter